MSNHDTNRSLQREARALAKERGIKYTAALRELNELKQITNPEVKAKVLEAFEESEEPTTGE